MLGLDLEAFGACLLVFVHRDVIICIVLDVGGGLPRVILHDG